MKKTTPRIADRISKAKLKDEDVVAMVPWILREMKKTLAMWKRHDRARKLWDLDGLANEPRK